MSAVADISDRDGDGYNDIYEFVAALHPNKDAYKPITDADKIEDEVALLTSPRPPPASSCPVRSPDLGHDWCHCFLYFRMRDCGKVLRIP